MFILSGLSLGVVVVSRTTAWPLAWGHKWPFWVTSRPILRNIPILQCKSMRFTTFFREHNVLCINHIKLHQESSKRSKDYKNDSWSNSWRRIYIHIFVIVRVILLTAPSRLSNKIHLQSKCSTSQTTASSQTRTTQLLWSSFRGFAGCIERRPWKKMRS